MLSSICVFPEDQSAEEILSFCTHHHIIFTCVLQKLVTF